jgi:O-antigen ligase
MHPPTPPSPSAERPGDGLVIALLVLPWVHPWAPGPQANTVPLLIGWGALAMLLALQRWPSALALAQGWACAALLSSAMGLLQYFGEAWSLDGWVHVPAYLGDAVGNLRQRNQLATLTALGAVAVLWWHRQGLSPKHALWMLALLATGNAATGSRTGLLQWLLLPALQGLWQTASRPRRSAWSWPLLLWALGIYLLASLALPPALAAWRGTGVDSAIARLGEISGCGSRSVLWTNVLHLIGQKPWTGWGWGELEYAHYITDYPGPRFCDILGNAHNLPLQLAFAFGVPAALALSGMVFVLVLRAQPWRLPHNSSSLGWGVLAMLALHSLLEYPLWYSPFQLAALLAILLLWPQARARLMRQQRSLALLALLGGCLLVFVGYDYQRMRQIYIPPSRHNALWSDDPWAHARQTVFFGDAVRFAEFTTTPVTPQNATAMLQTGLMVLHYSPEPRVIDQLIKSARLAGQETLAQWHTLHKAAVYGHSAP